jgi:hypothetical protein
MIIDARVCVMIHDIQMLKQNPEKRCPKRDGEGGIDGCDVGK